MRSKYKIVEDLDDLWELVGYVKQTGHCSHDFETTSLRYYQESEYLLCVGISFQPGSAWVVPLGHPESPFKDTWEWEVMPILKKEIFENVDIVKISQNTKFEFKWFLRYGVTMIGRCFDTMLAKHLLDEERPHGLEDMVNRWLPEFANYKGLVDNTKLVSTPLDEVAEYCGLDCDLAFRLFLHFEPKLIKLGFYQLFRNLFTPLTSVLGKCEFYGMPTDRKYLVETEIRYRTLIQDEADKLRNHKILRRFEKYSREDAKEKFIDALQDEIDALESTQNGRGVALRENKIKAVTEGKFELLPNKERKLFEPLNLNSPTQLINLFYDSEYGFEFPVLEYTKQKKGLSKKAIKTPSTSEETLLKLKEYDETGFLDGLLEHRGLQKLYSTYIKGILEILPADDFLRCNYKIHGTVTGRISSTEPNMQNIPRVTTNKDIKGMFVAPPGYLLVELDYSQAELRIVAELAGEKKMIEYFQKGYNIHVAVAVDAENVNTGKHYTYEEIYPITKDEAHPQYEYWTKRKKRAKTINFGILYEQSPAKLAETMKCSKGEATQFRLDWLKTFPRIEKWINNQHKLAHKNGYVTNMWGMKRRLPNIYSPNNGVMMEAERQAVNAPIQGASSLFTLFSTIIIEEYRMQGKIPLERPLLYTVHDSEGYLVRTDKIHEFVSIAIPIMKDPQTQEYFGFKMKQVPMKASVELGIKWNGLSDYSSKTDYTLLNPIT